MDQLELKKLLIQEAKELESYLITTRRHFHMYPELGYEEKETAAYVEKELNRIGYKTQRTAGTGIIAILKGEKPGKIVALRADIDALMVTEENDVEYKSKNLGKMHACGHDAHITCLLGAAQILFKYKDKINGTIKLIFQPAEEGGVGARKIVQEGHLDDVDKVFGLHVWLETPTGVIGTRKGAFFASADEFIITIAGKGGHAALPHQAIDPTSVAIDIYNALQKLVTREIDPLENAVLSTPVMEGSHAFNVIPPIATLRGTFRTMNPEVRVHLKKRIEEISIGYSKAWRCNANIEFLDTATPPLINDRQTTEEVIRILNDLDEVREIEAVMGAEDFSFYLEKTKGAFICLGIYNVEKGIIFPHHHPKFNIDESVLWKGTAIYTLLGFYSIFL